MTAETNILVASRDSAFWEVPQQGLKNEKRCPVGSTTWAIAGLPEMLTKEQADLAVIMPTTAKVPVWRAIHESQVNPNQGF